MSDEELRYLAPRRTPQFSRDAIVAVAKRACSLQGCPEVMYESCFDADTRHTIERGTYNVLAALESLGWLLIAPEPAAMIWTPRAEPLAPPRDERRGVVWLPDLMGDPPGFEDPSLPERLDK